MGTTLPRCCDTCVHFQELLGSCLGCCLHPARAPETDVAVLVRRRELPCRMRWSEDLWEQRPLARVVEVRMWGPFADDAALDALPGDLIGWLLRAVETGQAGEDAGRDRPCDQDVEDDGYGA